MSALLQFGARMKALPHEAALRRTYLGQAHIAGTGPEGSTCRECAFWGIARAKDGEAKICSPGHFAKSNKAQAGHLKKGSCHKLRHRKSNRQFPCSALACRLFEPAESPPPAIKPVEETRD